MREVTSTAYMAVFLLLKVFAELCFVQIIAHIGGHHAWHAVAIHLHRLGLHHATHHVRVHNTLLYYIILL